MIFVFKSTPVGFTANLTVAWKPLLLFIRNTILMLAAFGALLSSSVGAAALGAVCKLLGYR